MAAASDSTQADRPDGSPAAATTSSGDSGARDTESVLIRARWEADAIVEKATRHAVRLTTEARQLREDAADEVDAMTETIRRRLDEAEQLVVAARAEAAAIEADALRSLGEAERIMEAARTEAATMTRQAGVLADEAERIVAAARTQAADIVAKAERTEPTAAAPDDDEVGAIRSDLAKLETTIRMTEERSRAILSEAERRSAEIIAEAQRRAAG